MTIMYSLLFLSEMKPRRYDVELFFTIGENNVASLTYVYQMFKVAQYTNAYTFYDTKSQDGN